MCPSYWSEQINGLNLANRLGPFTTSFAHLHALVIMLRWLLREQEKQAFHDSCFLAFPLALVWDFMYSSAYKFFGKP
eukprot:1160540-Pelagomonas_calceolata.AAC.11